MSTNFKLNQNNLSRRKFIGIIFLTFCLLGVLVAMMGLISLLIQVILQGYEWVTPNLIFNYPSRHPEQAGLWSALIGTLYMMGLTALITVPVGIGAAIYLEEYAPKNWITSFIEINTSNLAGVPSIVYGLLGLSIFVYFLKLERSILAGSLTMSLLILPVLILASREAIKISDLTVTVDTRFLDRSAIQKSFVFERDLQDSLNTYSSLEKPVVLSYYLDEWKYWN